MNNLTKIHMISSNQRFVHHIAKRYKHSVRYYDDLISAGNVGMVEAAHRYDPNKGVKFTTYAYYWIRKEMLDLCRMEYKHNNNILINSQEIIECYTNDIASTCLLEDYEMDMFLVYLLPIERIVIKMKYIKNLSLKSISFRMQLPYNRVRNIHNTALSKLRKMNHFT